MLFFPLGKCSFWGLLWARCLLHCRCISTPKKTHRMEKWITLTKITSTAKRTQSHWDMDPAGRCLVLSGTSMFAADPLYAVSCDVEPSVDQTCLFCTFHRGWIRLRSGGIGGRVNTWNLCLSSLNHVQCIFHLSSITSSSLFSSLSYGSSFFWTGPFGPGISGPCPWHSFLFLPWNSVDRPD